MTSKKVKNWEDLINDGEQYGDFQGDYTPLEQTVVEAIKDKTVLKIQDKYLFSKTGKTSFENHGVELAGLLANFQPLEVVRSIIITHNELGPEGVKILCQSKIFRDIEYLHLGSNDLGDEGVKAVCQTEWFSKVHTLNLECNGITAEGAKALAESPVFAQVQSLNLVDNRVGDEGAYAIANSENFKNLTYLHLGGNRIKSEDAKKAVRESPKLAQLKTLKIF